MKKILFILAISVLVFSSCGNKKKQEKADNHTHSDGTVHSGETHIEASETVPAQEAFEVKPEEGTDHDHDHSEHN